MKKGTGIMNIVINDGFTYRGRSLEVAGMYIKRKQGTGS